jgi:Cu+-exporting ATPase
VLPLVAALETYSRHPLAAAVIAAAQAGGYQLPPVEWIRQEAGAGLAGRAGGANVLVTSRAHPASRVALPPGSPTGSSASC